MADQVDNLLIEVRAGTQGFAQDIATMRSSFDGTLVSGFTRGADVLEKGLLGAISKGSLGFGDLKKVALATVNEIAAQSLQGLFTSGSSASSSSSAAGVSSILGSLLGLPGRATGGPVAPGSAYVVGERGPELFVPTSSGRIETGTQGSSGRDVSVSINVSSPRGSSTPQALQRSTRQVASAVRRALTAG